MLGHQGSLLFVDDPRPQAVAHVGRQPVHRRLVGVEGHGEEAVLVEPEVPVEGRLEGLGPGPELLGQLGVAAFGGEVGAGHEGGVDVALHLAHGDRGPGQAAVGEADGVPGVLPALVDQAPVGGPLVLDVAVAVLVAVGGDPLQRPVGRREQGVDVAPPAPPPLQLAQHHDEQRGGVGAAVVDRPAAERDAGRLAEAHLVEDPARLLLGERVDGPPLEPGQGLERAQRQVGVDHHRHPRREQRVSPEQRHEPRRPGRHHRPVGVVGVEDPERGEVFRRTGQQGPERVVVAGHDRQ